MRPALFLGLVFAAVPMRAETPDTVIWRLDWVDRVGGHKTEIIGDPVVVDGAVVFDGVKDGLLVDTLPLTGAETFTMEALIRPASDGPEAQRFLHIQDVGDGRALLELRTDGDAWWLDSFLVTPSPQEGRGVVLIDPSRKHPTEQWHWVALRHDGTTMSHYVNGELQGAEEVPFSPFVSGRTSIGVRQNLVSWYRGAIREIRFSRRALASAELQRSEP